MLQWTPESIACKEVVLEMRGSLLSRLLAFISALTIVLGCSPGASTSPLASVTVREDPAGPSATHGLATVFVIEAVLDLKATGLRDFVDARSRMTYIEGKHKRFQADGGTLLVEGDTCRLKITLSSHDYYEVFGFVDYDPVVRIGLTLKSGTERMTAGVLQQKTSNP
jgi:hypothetical protein